MPTSKKTSADKKPKLEEEHQPLALFFDMNYTQNQNVINFWLSEAEITDKAIYDGINILICNAEALIKQHSEKPTSSDEQRVAELIAISIVVNVLQNLSSKRFEETVDALTKQGMEAKEIRKRLEALKSSGDQYDLVKLMSNIKQGSKFRSAFKEIIKKYFDTHLGEYDPLDKKAGTHVLKYLDKCCKAYLSGKNDSKERKTIPSFQERVEIKLKTATATEQAQVVSTESHHLQIQAIEKLVKKDKKDAVSLTIKFHGDDKKLRILSTVDSGKEKVEMAFTDKEEEIKLDPEVEQRAKSKAKDLFESFKEVLTTERDFNTGIKDLKTLIETKYSTCESAAEFVKGLDKLIELSDAFLTNLNEQVDAGEINEYEFVQAWQTYIEGFNGEELENIVVLQDKIKRQIIDKNFKSGATTEGFKSGTIDPIIIAQRLPRFTMLTTEYNKNRTDLDQRAGLSLPEFTDAGSLFELSKEVASSANVKQAQELQRVIKQLLEGNGYEQEVSGLIEEIRQLEQKDKLLLENHLRQSQVKNVSSNMPFKVVKLLLLAQLMSVPRDPKSNKLFDEIKQSQSLAQIQKFIIERQGKGGTIQTACEVYQSGIDKFTESNLSLKHIFNIVHYYTLFKNPGLTEVELTSTQEESKAKVKHFQGRQNAMMSEIVSYVAQELNIQTIDALQNQGRAKLIYEELSGGYKLYEHDGNFLLYIQGVYVDHIPRENLPKTISDLKVNEFILHHPEMAYTLNKACEYLKRKQAAEAEGKTLDPPKGGEENPKVYEFEYFEDGSAFRKISGALGFKSCPDDVAETKSAGFVLRRDGTLSLSSALADPRFNCLAHAYGYTSYPYDPDVTQWLNDAIFYDDPTIVEIFADKRKFKELFDGKVSFSDMSLDNKKIKIMAVLMTFEQTEEMKQVVQGMWQCDNEKTLLSYLKEKKLSKEIFGKESLSEVKNLDDMYQLLKTKLLTKGSIDLNAAFERDVKINLEKIKAHIISKIQTQRDFTSNYSSFRDGQRTLIIEEPMAVEERDTNVTYRIAGQLYTLDLDKKGKWDVKRAIDKYGIEGTLFIIKHVDDHEGSYKKAVIDYLHGIRKEVLPVNKAEKTPVVGSLLHKKNPMYDAEAVAKMRHNIKEILEGDYVDDYKLILIFKELKELEKATNPSTDDHHYREILKLSAIKSGKTGRSLTQEEKQAYFKKWKSTGGEYLAALDENAHSFETLKKIINDNILKYDKLTEKVNTFKEHLELAKSVLSSAQIGQLGDIEEMLQVLEDGELQKAYEAYHKIKQGEGAVAVYEELYGKHEDKRLYQDNKEKLAKFYESELLQKIHEKIKSKTGFNRGQNDIESEIQRLRRSIRTNIIKLELSEGQQIELNVFYDSKFTSIEGFSVDPGMTAEIKGAEFAKAYLDDHFELACEIHNALASRQDYEESLLNTIFTYSKQDLLGASYEMQPSNIKFALNEDMRIVPVHYDIQNAEDAIQLFEGHRALLTAEDKEPLLQLMIELHNQTCKKITTDVVDPEDNLDEIKLDNQPELIQGMLQSYNAIRKEYAEYKQLIIKIKSSDYYQKNGGDANPILQSIREKRDACLEAGQNFNNKILQFSRLADQEHFDLGEYEKYIKGICKNGATLDDEKFLELLTQKQPQLASETVAARDYVILDIMLKGLRDGNADTMGHVLSLSNELQKAFDNFEYPQDANEIIQIQAAIDKITKLRVDLLNGELKTQAHEKFAQDILAEAKEDKYICEYLKEFNSELYAFIGTKLLSGQDTNDKNLLSLLGIQKGSLQHKQLVKSEYKSLYIYPVLMRLLLSEDDHPIQKLVTVDELAYQMSQYLWAIEIELQNNGSQSDLNQARLIQSVIQELKKGTEAKIEFSESTGFFKELDSKLSIDTGRQLGKGEFGAVYAGTYKNNSVAVKQLLSTSEVETHRFELEMAASISVPESAHILRATACGYSEGSPVIVMPLAEGSLKDKLPTLDDKDRKECLLQVMQGLRDLHNGNWVHRDLAARNVTLHKVEDAWQFKIADMGQCVRLNEEGVYRDFRGTPRNIKWLSPLEFELLSRNTVVETRKESELWSLAVLMYEVIEGKEPSHIVEFYQDREGKAHAALAESVIKNGCAKIIAVQEILYAACLIKQYSNGIPQQFSTEALNILQADDNEHASRLLLEMDTDNLLEMAHGAIAQIAPQSLVVNETAKILEDNIPSSHPWRTIFSALKNARATEDEVNALLEKLNATNINEDLIQSIATEYEPRYAIEVNDTGYASLPRLPLPKRSHQGRIALNQAKERMLQIFKEYPQLFAAAPSSEPLAVPNIPAPETTYTQMTSVMHASQGYVAMSAKIPKDAHRELESTPEECRKSALQNLDGHERKLSQTSLLYSDYDLDPKPLMDPIAHNLKLLDVVPNFNLQDFIHDRLAVTINSDCSFDLASLKPTQSDLIAIARIYDVDVALLSESMKNALYLDMKMKEFFPRLMKSAQGQNKKLRIFNEGALQEGIMPYQNLQAFYELETALDIQIKEIKFDKESIASISKSIDAARKIRSYITTYVDSTFYNEEDFKRISDKIDRLTDVVWICEFIQNPTDQDVARRLHNTDGSLEFKAKLAQLIEHNTDALELRHVAANLFSEKLKTFGLQPAEIEELETRTKEQLKTITQKIQLPWKGEFKEAEVTINLNATEFTKAESISIQFPGEVEPLIIDQDNYQDMLVKHIHVIRELVFKSESFGLSEIIHDALPVSKDDFKELIVSNGFKLSVNHDCDELYLDGMAQLAIDQISQGFNAMAALSEIENPVAKAIHQRWVNKISENPYDTTQYNKFIDPELPQFEIRGEYYEALNLRAKSLEEQMQSIKELYLQEDKLTPQIYQELERRYDAALEDYSELKQSFDEEWELLEQNEVKITDESSFQDDFVLLQKLAIKAIISPDSRNFYNRIYSVINAKNTEGKYQSSKEAEITAVQRSLNDYNSLAQIKLQFMPLSNEPPATISTIDLSEPVKEAFEGYHDVKVSDLLETAEESRKIMLIAVEQQLKLLDADGPFNGQDLESITAPLLKQLHDLKYGLAKNNPLNNIEIDFPAEEESSERKLIIDITKKEHANELLEIHIKLRTSDDEKHIIDIKLDAASTDVKKIAAQVGELYSNPEARVLAAKLADALESHPDELSELTPDVKDALRKYFKITKAQLSEEFSQDTRKYKQFDISSANERITIAIKLSKGKVIPIEFGSDYKLIAGQMDAAIEACASYAEAHEMLTLLYAGLNDSDNQLGTVERQQLLTSLGELETHLQTAMNTHRDKIIESADDVERKAGQTPNFVSHVVENLRYYTAQDRFLFMNLEALFLAKQMDLEKAPNEAQPVAGKPKVHWYNGLFSSNKDQKPKVAQLDQQSKTLSDIVSQIDYQFTPARNISDPSTPFEMCARDVRQYLSNEAIPAYVRKITVENSIQLFCDRVREKATAGNFTQDSVKEFESILGAMKQIDNALRDSTLFESSPILLDASEFNQLNQYYQRLIEENKEVSKSFRIESEPRIDVTYVVKNDAIIKMVISSNETEIILENFDNTNEMESFKKRHFDLALLISEHTENFGDSKGKAEALGFNLNRAEIKLVNQKEGKVQFHIDPQSLTLEITASSLSKTELIEKIKEHYEALSSLQDLSEETQLFLEYISKNTFKEGPEDYSYNSDDFPEIAEIAELKIIKELKEQHEDLVIDILLYGMVINQFVAGDYPPFRQQLIDYYGELIEKANKLVEQAKAIADVIDEVKGEADQKQKEVMLEQAQRYIDDPDNETEKAKFDALLQYSDVPDKIEKPGQFEEIHGRAQKFIRDGNGDVLQHEVFEGNEWFAQLRASKQIVLYQQDNDKLIMQVKVISDTQKEVVLILTGADNEPAKLKIEVPIEDSQALRKAIYDDINTRNAACDIVDFVQDHQDLLSRVPQEYQAIFSDVLKYGKDDFETIPSTHDPEELLLTVESWQQSQESSKTNLVEKFNQINYLLKAITAGTVSGVTPYELERYREVLGNDGEKEKQQLYLDAKNALAINKIEVDVNQGKRKKGQSVLQVPDNLQPVYAYIGEEIKAIDASNEPLDIKAIKLMRLQELRSLAERNYSKSEYTPKKTSIFSGKKVKVPVNYLLNEHKKSYEQQTKWLTEDNFSVFHEELKGMIRTDRHERSIFNNLVWNYVNAYSDVFETKTLDNTYATVQENLQQLLGLEGLDDKVRDLLQKTINEIDDKKPKLLLEDDEEEVDEVEDIVIEWAEFDLDESMRFEYREEEFFEVEKEMIAPNGVRFEYHHKDKKIVLAHPEITVNEAGELQGINMEALQEACQAIGKVEQLQSVCDFGNPDVPEIMDKKPPKRSEPPDSHEKDWFEKIDRVYKLIQQRSEQLLTINQDKHLLKGVKAQLQEKLSDDIDKLWQSIDSDIEELAQHREEKGVEKADEPPEPPIPPAPVEEAEEINWEVGQAICFEYHDDELHLVVDKSAQIRGVRFEYDPNWWSLLLSDHKINDKGEVEGVTIDILRAACVKIRDVEQLKAVAEFENLGSLAQHETEETPEIDEPQEHERLFIENITKQISEIREHEERINVIRNDRELFKGLKNELCAPILEHIVELVRQVNEDIQTLRERKVPQDFGKAPDVLVPPEAHEDEDTLPDVAEDKEVDWRTALGNVAVLINFEYREGKFYGVTDLDKSPTGIRFQYDPSEQTLNLLGHTIHSSGEVVGVNMQSLVKACAALGDVQGLAFKQIDFNDFEQYIIPDLQGLNESERLFIKYIERHMEAKKSLEARITEIRETPHLIAGIKMQLTEELQKVLNDLNIKISSDISKLSQGQARKSFESDDSMIKRVEIILETLSPKVSKKREPELVDEEDKLAMDPAEEEDEEEDEEDKLAVDPADKRDDKDLEAQRRRLVEEEQAARAKLGGKVAVTPTAMNPSQQHAVTGESEAVLQQHNPARKQVAKPSMPRQQKVQHVNKTLSEFNKLEAQRTTHLNPNVGTAQGAIQSLPGQPDQFFKADMSNTVTINGRPPGTVRFDDNENVVCSGTAENEKAIMTGILSFLAAECKNFDAFMQDPKADPAKGHDGKDLILFINSPGGEPDEDFEAYSREIKKVAAKIGLTAQTLDDQKRFAAQRETKDQMKQMARVARPSGPPTQPAEDVKERMMRKSQEAAQQMKHGAPPEGNDSTVKITRRDPNK